MTAEGTTAGTQETQGQGRLAGLGRRFALLGLRDLRYVFGATLVSTIGDGMVGIALAFAVLNLTHSATDLGVILAARTITMVVVMLIGGVVADRLSRRAVMIGADIVRCGGQVAIGVLLITGTATVAEIIVSQIIVSAGDSFFEPASMGLIGAAAGEHKQEANALRVMATSTTGMVGPALGGVLVATVGGSYALVADGITYLISAALLSRLSSTLIPARANAGEAPGFLDDLRAGFGEVRSRRWVWMTILNMSVGNMLMASWMVLGPVVCRRHYGGAPAWAGLSVAFVAGMLVGGSLLLRVKPRFPLRLGFLVCIPGLAPLILLGLNLPILIVGATQVISGIGATLLNALWWTAMQEHIPERSISRVSSYDWAGSLAIQPIGLILAGPLAAGLGASSALAVCGAAAMAVTASGLLVSDIRNLGAAVAPA